MKLNGDSAEHWHESCRDLSTHLPWQPEVPAAATTTQRVCLCSTPWPRHRPPRRRRIASDWHSTQTSAPGLRRRGQSAVTALLTLVLWWTLPPDTDALEHERRTSVTSNCIQYLRTHTCKQAPKSGNNNHWSTSNVFGFRLCYLWRNETAVSLRTWAYKNVHS